MSDKIYFYIFMKKLNNTQELRTNVSRDFNRKLKEL
jgi:hypothetical protein